MAVVQSGDRIWAMSPQPPQDPTDAWSCPALWDLPSSPCCCPVPCQGCVPGCLSPPHTTPCATNSPELCVRAFSPCLQTKPPPAMESAQTPTPNFLQAEKQAVTVHGQSQEGKGPLRTGPGRSTCAHAALSLPEMPVPGRTRLPSCLPRGSCYAGRPPQPAPLPLLKVTSTG